MDCIFCKIVKGEIPCEALLDTEEILAFRDIRPQAPVHILVVPKKHVATLNELGDEDSRLPSEMVRAAVELAHQEGIEASGYRLVMNCNRHGGQEVFHLHLHLMGGRPLGAMCAPPSGTYEK